MFTWEKKYASSIDYQILFNIFTIQISNKISLFNTDRQTDKQTHKRIDK